MYNFHEAVSQLQQQEEEVLDFHKDVIELEKRWLGELMDLLNSTREVDYDQEGKTPWTFLSLAGIGKSKSKSVSETIRTEDLKKLILSRQRESKPSPANSISAEMHELRPKTDTLKVCLTHAKTALLILSFPFVYIVGFLYFGSFDESGS